MPESFGARLRQQREKNGIALQALAKQTRIKESLLEGLERDDLSAWPSGFYRRAFFRAYASAIQLDPDAAFIEFQQVHPEPPEGDVLTAMAAALGLDQQRRRQGLRSKVESAIGSLARLRPNAPSDRKPAAAEPSNCRPAAAPPAPALEPDCRVVVQPKPSAVALPAQEVAPQPAAMAPAPQVPQVSVAEPAPDLMEVARVCTAFGCVTAEDELQVLLQQAAHLIGATGLIVWALDPHALHLQAAFAHGYSRRLVSHLPMVRPDDHNATAEAFRTAQTRVFTDSGSGKAAIAIPLRTAFGCVGVFAVELERGLEPTKSRIAVGTLLAAQLAPIADSLSRAAAFELPLAVSGQVQAV